MPNFQETIVRNAQEMPEVLRRINFPVTVRPSYSLPGQGMAEVRTVTEFETAVKKGLELSPIGEVLVEWG